MWYVSIPGAQYMRFMVPTMTPDIPYILNISLYAVHRVTFDLLDISTKHYVINPIPYSKPPYHMHG